MPDAEFTVESPSYFGGLQEWRVWLTVSALGGLEMLMIYRVELADGRSGDVRISHIDSGAPWTIAFMGSGPLS